MGWKSVSCGARDSLPLHWGSASWRILVGSWLALIRRGLYTSTLTRPEMPTQSPWGELYLAGERLSVAESTLASRPLSWRLSSGGEFSVRNTSAGEFGPS